METPTQLAHRLREVFLNGTWIANTNFKDQLSQIDWQQATHKIDSLNTIAGLAFHINYYLAGVLEVFKGEPLTIRDKFSFDCPPIHSQKEWEILKNVLFTNAAQFATFVEIMTEAQLNSPFVKEEYGDFRRNIEGMIEHCYYHFGQIVLLSKLVDN